MSQNPFSKKVKIYTFSAVALIATAIVLRIFNFLFLFDTATDYFDHHPLHIIYIALCLLTVLWLLTSIIFIPRYSFSTKTQVAESPLSRWLSLFCACMTVASFFYFQDCMRYYTAHAKIYHFLAIFSLISALYFALYFIDGCNKALISLFGYATLIWLGLMLSATYMNLYVPMNSPFKVTQHLATLSLMLHILEDTRRHVGRPFRIAYFTYTLIAILTCGIASFPVLLAYILGLYPNFDYLIYSLLMLGFFCYLCVRAYDCYRTLMVTPIASQEEIDEDIAKKKAEKNKKKTSKKEKASDTTENDKGGDTNVC